VKYVLLRGPSSCGKTTLAIKLAKELKKKGFKPALIHEDNYRKSLQFKYKAAEKEPHIYSVNIILNVIDTLISNDDYDVIILEGLFRFSSMLDMYYSRFAIHGYEVVQPLETRQKWNSMRAEPRLNLDDYELEKYPKLTRLENGVSQIINDYFD